MATANLAKRAKPSRCSLPHTTSMAPPLRHAPGLLSVRAFMRAENLSAPASRRVRRGVGEAHGSTSSSTSRRSSFSPACHLGAITILTGLAVRSPQAKPLRTPHKTPPRHSFRNPGLKELLAAPLHDLHSLSVNSPPRLQNNPRTQILRICNRHAAAELRPSATQPLRGSHNAAERLQRAHRRGRYGDAAPTPSALPSLLLVACVFSVRTSAEPPLAL